MTELFINIALGLLSTTYGYNESHCGDIGKPIPCSVGAITASGEIFDPEMPTMAVFAPTHMKMKATVIYVKLRGVGKCEYIRVNDKGNPRYIGKRGFDLTPSAIRLLGDIPNRYWSGVIEPCLDFKEETQCIKSDQ